MGLKRRDALKGVVVGAVGLVLGGLNAADAESANAAMNSRQTADAARAFRGQHQPKPLPFDPAKLRGISEKLIRSHHENNYTGAVKALNAVEQRLDAMMKDKELPPYVYGAAAAKYVDAFMQNVKWEEVNRRAEEALRK